MISELFTRISQGDHQAFATLVDQYWNRLYSQAMVYVKDSHKAQKEEIKASRGPFTLVNGTRWQND